MSETGHLGLEQLLISLSTGTFARSVQIHIFATTAFKRCKAIPSPSASASQGTCGTEPGLYQTMPRVWPHTFPVARHICTNRGWTGYGQSGVVEREQSELRVFL